MLPAGQHTSPQSSNHLKLLFTQTVNSSLYSYEIPIFCRTPSGRGRMRNFDLQPTNEHTIFFLSHFSSQYSWQPFETHHHGVSLSSKVVLLLYIQSMSNLNQPPNSREEFSEYESLLSVHPLFQRHSISPAHRSREHTDTLSFEHKLKSFAEQPRLPHRTKVGRWRNSIAHCCGMTTWSGSHGYCIKWRGRASGDKWVLLFCYVNPSAGAQATHLRSLWTHAFCFYWTLHS